MRGVIALRELEENVEFRSDELTAVAAVKQVEELVNSGIVSVMENGDTVNAVVSPNLPDGEREEPPK